MKERPDPALAALMQQITEARGLCCAAYKIGCFRRRLTVRMRALGVQRYEDYAQLLVADPAEYDRLLDALTINVTRFYRNPETWNVLAARVLPRLWAGGGAPRCWSAGCSSGEEPYTLAMLLLEHARGTDGAQVPEATVDGTDLDVASLEQAGQGRYPRAMLRDTPPHLVHRYFDAADPATLSPEVRRVVRFRRHDLLKDPPPNPPYDLILCRNVAIYFDRASQDRLFAGLTDALAPGGYLVLGKVEAIWGSVRSRLVLDDVRERIYRRR